MIDASTMPEDGRCTPYQTDGRLGAHFILQPGIIQMLQEKEGKRFLPGWLDGSSHYVKEGALVERPTNPARLDGMTLRDLPVPCVIVIDGARYDCDEPVAELDLSGPGMYAVTVEAFPALDASFVVEVPA